MEGQVFDIAMLPSDYSETLQLVQRLLFLDEEEEVPWELLHVPENDND